ncbi:MAG: rRNA maturation RNase YbeY [Oscillospiraceae bacterium]|nr:rRNA maturation RNase YbeY [Oscillospiraceae bacterium]
MTEVYVSREKKNLGHPQCARLIRSAVEKTLHAEGITERCIVSVLLTDDEGIREANREFRQVDSATDVLSFPLNELKPGEFHAEDCEREPDTGAVLLGDMMLNLRRCEEQGEEYGHGFNHEIQYLTVHSVLHLLGYDHVDEGEDKKRMRSREKAIMGETE